MASTGLPEEPAARLTALFDLHHRTVLAYAARRVGADRAADVAAEVFTVAWRRLPDIPPAAELPWLLVVARNLLAATARSEARRADREQRAADRSAPPGTADDHAGRASDRDVIRRALERLSEPDRELLQLVAWDRLPLNQAAQVLGCSAGAARVRWLRARRRFAAALGAEQDDRADPVQADPVQDQPRSRPTTVPAQHPGGPL